MWDNLWQALRGTHGGKIIGVIIGVSLGCIYLFAGFWDMLFFAIIVYIGYYIGSMIDRGRPPFYWQLFYEWLTDRWRGFK